MEGLDGGKVRWRGDQEKRGPSRDQKRFNEIKRKAIQRESVRERGGKGGPKENSKFGEVGEVHNHDPKKRRKVDEGGEKIEGRTFRFGGGHGARS